MTRHYTPRTLVPLAVRIENGVMPVTECGCWIWMGLLDANGYGQIKVAGRMERVHRASWKTFVGPIPAGMKALHRCDIRCCANPDHLFLGTQFDNMADMFRKGRNAVVLGEANPNSKLTADQVREIRQSGLGCVALGKQYGVGKSMISYIKTGKNWTHV